MRPTPGSAAASSVHAPRAPTQEYAGAIEVLEFSCQGARFALPLDCVRRAVMSAQPEPLPGASDIVLGIINIAGETVTVVDFARQVGLPPTVIGPSQQFLVVDLGGFACALVADHVAGVLRHAARSLPWPDGVGSAEFVDGALQLDDGVCLVIDPLKFLFQADKIRLAAALKEAGHD
jgi:purine-binding chemotaxis protein CheW